MTDDAGPPTFDAGSPAQMRALAHPMRHRILAALREDGATVSQLSHRLRTNKGNAAHHVKVLVAAGLVRRGPRRTVRGGTEQYYVRVAPRIRISPGEDGVVTRAMLATMAEEIPTDDDHLLNHRRLRLTARQAEALADYLDRLVNELESANRREREYGVVVGVWPTTRR
ncbi:helix-turn-helix domain-containing protein [Luteipulveratus sp. YIM 133132]|uniref:ArsR/SmtB family transcription factor n=1 Tax=Luteipulveratus flavus TaxID=3031728 RepID=UPI0023AF2A8D|nr:helix-turn-helix domain-containing protein [Luteipulveratus sp. YIM 133132]MDE9366634.1 helix-turn-helix domain-containing protein [Luteipulveratus sp. YIM 133132]